MSDDLISRSALREEHLKLDFFPAITRHLIDNAPAVDAVPVVHGRWEWRGGVPWCSNCGEMLNGYSYDNGVYTTPYCSECGAKMDGGNDG